ncbi:MAG: (Fe-S)-binding protein [Rhodospirillales bacterium]
MNFSWVEKTILLVLLAASVAAFSRTFGAALRNIFASAKDSDFRLRPLGPRLRKFFWEVLAQGLVIRQRPLPGLAHAIVFWGFLAFAAITLNHIALALGLAFIPAGSGYKWFVAAFALAVAAAIAGLAFRRFVIRPKWLEPVSPESGLIAFLIFALMITYLLEFRIPEGGAAAKINWWAHTAVLLFFLPLIPHTKHLHLVLSPFTVFLERHGFSRIPPLAGDEDFGLDTGKDLTRIYSLQAYTCVECGRCTEHCPANNTGKILDPKEIILGTRSCLKEYGPHGTEPLLGKHISMEAAFQCTTCGACEFQCPVGIQHLPFIIGLRRGAVNTGKWEDSHGTDLFLNLERHGNSLGFAHAEREKFIEKNRLPYYDGSQEYCLWMGCMGSYDPQGREIVLAFARVLKHLGIGFGVLRREKCTGDPARRLGNDYLFGELAQANIEQMRRSGVRRLVSICPHCVRTILEDWREFGAEFQIEHHSELLARHLAQLPANQASRFRIVFHDACYLGRYRGIYDAPREVIARSAEVVNPARSRERGFCCGAGGGLAFLGEEKGKRVNLERAEQLLETRPDMVGAACPFCHTMLRDGLAAAVPQPPPLLDIAQIAAASLDATSAADPRPN